MLRSMTAYGRAVISSTLGRFVVEISSVNRKHLEISINLPQALQRFDTDIRKWIGSSVYRGRVSVLVRAQVDQGCPTKIQTDLPLAKQFAESANLLRSELGLPGSLGLETVLGCEGVLQLSQELDDVDGVRSALQETVEEALGTLTQMKCVEGQHLAEDIESRIDAVEALVSSAENATDGTLEAYRDRLTKRISELAPELPDTEDRILREAALLADRADITEELTRLKSHLKKFRATMRADRQGTGKTLDFLIQELVRETNTVGSKAAKVELSHLAVEIKSELERVREQVQNVE